MRKKHRLTIGEMKRKISAFAKKQKWEICFNSPECHPGQGAATDKVIWLGKFKNPRRMALVFCHEAGHCLLAQSARTTHKHPNYCIYEQEFTAWQKAFDLYYGVFGLKFNQYDADFISSCLSTYRFNVASNFYKDM